MATTTTNKKPVSVLSQTAKWIKQPVSKRVQTNPAFSPAKQAASNELIARAYGPSQERTHKPKSIK